MARAPTRPDGAAPGDGAGASLASIVPPVPGAGRTVFVIDDDEAVRDALATSLEAAGYSVLPFASARQFLDQYTAGESGCLIVALDLPVMDGAALLHLLAARGITLPAVVTSARLRNLDLARCLPSKHAALLEKPFGNEELLARVAEALATVEETPRTRVAAESR